MTNLKQCPMCGGSGKKESIDGQIISCWKCIKNKAIPKMEILRGLLFEAMIQDSINLRQKLLWTEAENDLLMVGKDQIKCFEESIEAKIEEDYIIEEYREHLNRFKEWFEIFKMDLKLITSVKNGSAFRDDIYNYNHTDPRLLIR